MALAKLQRLFLESPTLIVSALSQVIHGDIDAIAKSLVVFLEAHNNTDVVKWCITDAINSAESYLEVFRDRTLSVQIISEYFGIASRNYMKATLGPIVKKLMGLKKALEVDPRVLTGNLEDNIKQLHDLAVECKSAIFESDAMFPTNVRNTLAFLSKQLGAKFKEDHFRVLAIFVFSRILLPPLMQPSNYGIIKQTETWSPEASRTSILLCKILSNIASGTEFEEQTPLYPFNDIVISSKLSLKEFIDRLINGEQTVQLDPVNLAPDLVSNAFKCIHSHLFWAKDAIMEYRKATSSASAHAASTQKARIFFDLMSLLEDIELAEGKPDPIELSMLDIDDASKRVQANPKRTGRPPSASFRERNTMRPSTTTGSSNSVPFVRQMSEKFNREHQRIQLEAFRQKQQQEEKQRKLAEQKALKAAPPKSPTKKSKPSSTSENAVEDDSTNNNDTPSQQEAETENKVQDNEKEKKLNESDKVKKEKKREDAEVDEEGKHKNGDEKAKKEKREKDKEKKSGEKKEKKERRDDKKDDSKRDDKKDDAKKDKDDKKDEAKKEDAEKEKEKEKKEDREERHKVRKFATRQKSLAIDLSTAAAIAHAADLVERTSKSNSKSSLNLDDNVEPLSPILPLEEWSMGRARSSSFSRATTPRSYDYSRAEELGDARRQQEKRRSASTPKKRDQKRSSNLDVTASEKNVDSLSSLVRQLGIENAQLLKHKKELQAQVESLQAELEKVKREAKEKEQQMQTYNNRLMAAITKHHQRDSEVRQAALRLKYTNHRWFDDNSFDFRNASAQERRTFILNLVNYPSPPKKRVLHRKASTAAPKHNRTQSRSSDTDLSESDSVTRPSSRDNTPNSRRSRKSIDGRDSELKFKRRHGGGTNESGTPEATNDAAKKKKADRVEQMEAILQ